MPSRSDGPGVQRQAQADRDACDRLLKAIFDRGLGQRQIARVTGIPLSTVQRALQRVIYPYRQDRPIEDAPTWKKRRAKLESLALDQLQPTREHTALESRVAPRKSRVTLALPGHASEGGDSRAGALATESERKRAIFLAEVATHPSFNAAAVIAEFGGASGELELKALTLRLSDSVDAVWANDMRGPEAMLYSEAHALQAIFVDLSRRATKQSHMGNYESFMRMALKAQSQCRATLETLANIKNPPVVFARQANIAQGPQQVNNAMMPAGEPRARGKSKPSKTNYQGARNELLPDARTPGAAIGSDPAMAPLGTLNGAEVRRG